MLDIYDGNWHSVFFCAGLLYSSVLALEWNHLARYIVRTQKYLLHHDSNSKILIYLEWIPCLSVWIGRGEKHPPFLIDLMCIARNTMSDHVTYLLINIVDLFSYLLLHFHKYPCKGIKKTNSQHRKSRNLDLL